MVSNSGAYSSISLRTAEALIIHLLTFGSSSYDLPFHASDANVYPLLSSDGACIVVYGHERGLSLYKIHGQSAEAQHSSSKNGQSIIVDSIKDESSNIGPRLKRWLNVELESPVQHIAFPPISSYIVNNASHVPDSLTSELIIVASCEDLTVVLISVPLAAKKDENDDSRSRTDVKITYIGRGGGHQDSISAIAVTWTAENFHKLDKDSRSRSRGREIDLTGNTLHFLVASASTTGSGLLVICQIPFEAHFTSEPDTHTVILRQLVQLPLLGSVLVFNSSVQPSSSHPSLLLASPIYGIVQVYDLARHSLPLPKKRTDAEQLTGSDDTIAISSKNAILTLHTPYTSSAQPCRKRILDASWVSSRQAIVALLEDGEWGLWHINLPNSKSSSHDGGGRFTSLGQLTTTSPIKRSPKTKTSSSLAPMTPHTRKTKSADLFGQTPHSSGTSSTSSIKTGKVTLCSQSRSNTSQSDALILSYDGIHHYLPSLQAFSQSVPEEGRSRIAVTGRLHILPEIRLGGGHRIGTHTVHALSAADNSSFLGTMDQTPDLVVLTDTRLLIFTKSEAQPKGPPSTRDLVFRGIVDTKPTVSRRSNNGTLDVEGIDKILDSMEESDVFLDLGKGMRQQPSKASQLPEVGGLVREEPQSPSDLAVARSAKLVIDQKGSSLRRTLFASSK